MGVFEMCDECKGEYENPLDRRFHAEPISCPKCGPKLTFSDKNGIEIKCEDPVKMCADELKKGKIIAIKGLGGFHLACDATDFVAVESLRIRKRRAKKPLAVMFKTVDGIQKICKVNKKELSLLVSRHAPIVILKKKKKFSLVQNLSFESGFLGVFLPYTPLQLMLFSHIDFPLVMTSANISEEPIITEFDELIKKLGNVVDFVLDFDRKVINGCDDSVVRVFGGHQIFLRLARGYAPMNSNISGRFEIDTLAMGAQQKSTISFGIKNLVVTSAHIADLFSVESIQKYKNTIKSLSNLYGFEPRMVVNDKNIAYESTKYAKEFGVKTIGLQHHKAHFLAGLYEAKLLGREALGVIFDGTGLGDDGTVWGGEFFVYKNHKIVRACHLKEFWLLGGEASAKHPNRSALAILFDIYGDEVLEMKNHTTESFTSLELRTLLQLHKTGANSIRTSSIGRLFDAVASHIGLVQKESYDGESGLLIESKYDSSIKSIYDVKISDKIDFSEVFRADDGPIKGASKFLNTLAFVIGEVASKYNLPIVFSGGVFQNATLCQLVSKELKSRSLKAHFHKNLSPNDSSISIGQAIYGRMNDPAFCNRNPCS
jgi:hydrogenase maturation protein HypF